MKTVISVSIIAAMLVVMAFKSNITYQVSNNTLQNLPLSRLTTIQVLSSSADMFTVTPWVPPQILHYVDIPVPAGFGLVITNITFLDAQPGSSSTNYTQPIHVWRDGTVVNNLFTNYTPQALTGTANSYNFVMNAPIVILPGQQVRLITGNGTAALSLTGYVLLPGEF